ncbi:hypothetical protein CCP3SC1_1030011 [Gammaproteobacteria bacterium]
MGYYDFLGCVWNIANNGAEAIERASANAYDLILMDMQMPVTDGLTAARAIRLLPVHQTTPILAMTANVFHEDRVNCLAAGMNAFIAKPVESDTFFETLLKWLSPRTGYYHPVPETHPDVQPVSNNVILPNPLPTSLEVTPEIDSAVGMKNMWSNDVDYARFLSKYEDLHADDSERLRISIEQGDENKARCLAHSLKGISGMLGLSRVNKAAAALESALREGQDSTAIENLVTMLDVEQRSVSVAIKNFVSVFEKSEEPSLNLSK